MARLKKLAEWLEREYPSAAAGRTEGLEECFAINLLYFPLSLQRCMANTNIIESPHAGVRMRTRRVCRWPDNGMIKALDGGSPCRNPEELLKDYGPLGSLGFRCDPERIEVCQPTGGGVVI